MLKEVLQAEEKHIKWKLRSPGSKMIKMVRKKIISMKTLISGILDKQQKINNAREKI